MPQGYPKPDCTGFAVSVREGNRLHGEVSALTARANGSHRAASSVRVLVWGAAEAWAAGQLPRSLVIQK